MSTPVMLPRDRVQAALAFRPVDVPPLQYHSSPAGLHEHGERLKELWRRYPEDFNVYGDLPILHPDPKWIGPDGSYHELRRDAWGVLWEQRIFGVAGHPLERPLDDWRNLDRFKAPALPATTGPEFEAEQRRVTGLSRTHFVLSGWINLFEVMVAVRRYEDVLMDLATDAPEIHRLADIIVDYQCGMIDYLVKRGVDAIYLADDWGTQSHLILSQELWRRFFKPRYQRFVDRVRCAGKHAFFHCCGQVWDLLEEFADLGLAAIWPQLPAYDVQELANRCRALKLAVAVHPDRGHLMTHGQPDEVRQEVRRLAKLFRIETGGSWFYVEIDNGFPFENVKALIETIGEMRRE